MTVTGRTEDVAKLAGCSVGVTASAADEAGWSGGEALVVEMGAEPVVVADADRAAYADALAAASEFSTAVITQAADALRGLGIEHPGRVLGSLVRSSVENALAAAETDAAVPPGSIAG
jgi:predicted short-subunit dehydrogenase-like oxidoreductase (DUF2520 family)